MYGAEVHRERVTEPLPLVDDGGGVVLDARHRDAEHHQRLAGQPQPVQGRTRAGTALERRAEQVGPQPALHVGSGADPEQVQRDQLGGVLEGLGALVAERAGHRRPDRAEHLVARADRDRDARHRERVVPVGGGVDEHRLVAAVQLAEVAVHSLVIEPIWNSESVVASTPVPLCRSPAAWSTTSPSFRTATAAPGTSYFSISAGSCSAIHACTSDRELMR